LRLDYAVQYKKGVENKAANDLSRRPAEGVEDVVFTISEIVLTWLQELRTSYDGDQWVEEISHKGSQQQEGEDGISVHATIIRK
jgi:hypothetical protein